MEKLPYRIKQKIIKLNKLQQESSRVQDEIADLLGEHGLEIDLFLANAGISALDQTEALANILNGQIRDCDIDESIAQIEEVFIKQSNIALEKRQGN